MLKRNLFGMDGNTNISFKTRSLVLIPLFSILTAVGAFIKIPFFPVPLTLQLVFVILSGLLLGPKNGLASQLIYIFMGLIGLPIFAYGGGIGYIFNPTFGYLLGFATTSYVVGKMNEKLLISNQNFLRLLIICLVGTISCYAIGIPYLYLILRFITHKPAFFSALLLKGFIIFIPADILKIFIVSFLVKEINMRIKTF